MVQRSSASSCAQCSQSPNWQLVYSIEAADGTSVREYQAKSPVPGRMYQMRVCEDASGSYGSYSITR